MKDLIERQAAIDDLHGKDPSQIWDTADVEVWLNDLPSAQSEPCEDAVSRQWLLDEYDKRHKGTAGGARKIIEEAPSAPPERKTGKWIYITDGHYEYFKCDQCEKHSGEPTPFCRYCGADMREGQDDSI